MRILQAEERTLDLGRRGEHLATRIRFPAAAWRTLYGEGSFQLVVRRAGDSLPYFAVLAADGDFVCWDVTGADTAKAGTGSCELHYYVGGALAKSRLWTTRVAEALSGAETEAPAPYRPWVEQVLKAASEAKEAAARPPRIGENGDWFVWDAAAGDYADSGVSANALPSGGAAGDHLVRTEESAAWAAFPAYGGAYEVTPLTGASVTLDTGGTYLDRDVVVKAIPVYKTENPEGGNTIIIGG